MSHKKIHIYFLALALIMIINACKKKDPSIDDNFLNYKIPDVPATANYLVGAFYYTSSVWNANIKQVPTIGIYTTPTTGVVPPAVMQAHIDQAAAAKIDYFVFSVRSPTLDNTNYKVDSSVVNSFISSSNSSKMNFVVSYNMSTATLGITNSGGTNNNGVPLEANATKLAGFYNDFVRLSFWFNKSNYQKVNGKWIVLINNAQDLNSNMDPTNAGSNAPLYAEMRKRLSALGFDVYIIGMYQNWTVPNNYYYRYQNCVDAMYEYNMIDNKGIPDRYALFPQMCDQNWAYSKQELESWPAGGLTPGAKNLEFVPCIQPGYSYQILSPSSTSYSTGRTADGAFYKTYTNIAKRNASASRLILIDSFNNYQSDTELESTVSYGTTYLDLTKQAFKVN